MVNQNRLFTFFFLVIEENIYQKSHYEKLWEVEGLCMTSALGDNFIGQKARVSRILSPINNLPNMTDFLSFSAAQNGNPWVTQSKYALRFLIVCFLSFCGDSGL